MRNTTTTAVAEHPRKWRRPAPCPECGCRTPIIVRTGRCYRPETGKTIAVIWACICPACRHRLAIFALASTGTPDRNRAIRTWNQHATTTKRKATK